MRVTSGSTGSRVHGHGSTFTVGPRPTPQPIGCYSQLPDTPMATVNRADLDHDQSKDNNIAGKKKKFTKRRKVNHACLYGRRSHTTCDEGKPCRRW
jgi:hypothetical protein